MNTLELKHIAPYLPYDVKFAMLNDDDNTYYIDKERNTLECGGLNGVANILIAKYSRPIYMLVLRPLSDLINSGEWRVKLMSFLSNGQSDEINNKITIHTKNNQSTFKIRMYIYEGLNNSEYIEYTVYKNLDLSMTKYSLIEWAFENHFDVFGLIEKGLAIDINTINQ